MTDAHTPLLLSDADAAADLAGLPKPGQARLVSSEEARAMAANLPHLLCAISAQEETLEQAAVMILQLANERDDGITLVFDLTSDRDELASRVSELESEVLDQCRLNGMGAERELALMGRVAELEAERERLTLSRADRECLRIGQELQRAASDLPEGFVIEIAVELGYGGVTLIDENYKTQDFTDTVDGLSHCITQAIDAALSTTPKSKP